MQLLKYTFLPLLSISPLTAAVPAPSTTHPLLHTINEPRPVCRLWRCPNDTPASHAYCKIIGCDSCVDVGFGPDVYYVCKTLDASRAASASNGGNISTIDLGEVSLENVNHKLD